MIIYARGSWTWALLVSTLLVALLTPEVCGKGVSNKPDEKYDKAKIQMLQSYAPAARANGTLLDEEQVHPLVVSYLGTDSKGDGSEGVDGFDRGEGFDVNAAVSFDEGQTWKKVGSSLSQSAKKETYHGRRCVSKHSEEDGDHQTFDRRYLQDDGDNQDDFDFDVQAFKPMIVAKGNRVLVAWTSKKCRSGVPGMPDDLNGTDDSLGPDVDDLDPYQVQGRQGCVDYGESSYGKVAFNCVWAARGIINSVDDIVWSKAERLTSGRRDAAQLVAAVSGDGTVWALAWQEDPRGLREGEAAGPGDGMSK